MKKVLWKIMVEMPTKAVTGYMRIADRLSENAIVALTCVAVVLAILGNAVLNG